MYKFVITLRYIRRRLITLFSIIGIAIGVAVLIVVLSVMDGFRREFTSRLQGTLSDIVVSVHSQNPVYKEIEKKVLSVPNVKACSPHLTGLVLFGADNGDAGGIVCGIDYEKERIIGKLSEYLVTAYKDHKIWAETLLEENIKSLYCCHMSWKVLNVEKVQIEGYTELGTRLLCAQIQDFIPNRNDVPRLSRLLFSAFTIKDGKIILLEKELVPDLVTSALFRADDFSLDFGARLCSAADPLSMYLVQQFPPRIRELLASRSWSLDIYSPLNRVLLGPSLYDERMFRDVELRPETKELLAMSPKGMESIRLNRMLLEDAYPREIVHYRFLRKEHVKLDDLVDELQDQDNPLSRYFLEHFSPELEKRWKHYCLVEERYEADPANEQLRRQEEEVRSDLKEKLWKEVQGWANGKVYLFSLPVSLTRKLNTAEIAQELRLGFGHAKSRGPRLFGAMSGSFKVAQMQENSWSVLDNGNVPRYWLERDGNSLNVYSKKVLYSEEHFSRVKLSSNSMELLGTKSEKFDESQMIALNCSLLQDAYPYAIKMSHHLPPVSISAVGQFSKWQSYFDNMSKLFNDRNLVGYLEHYSHDLHYISLKKPRLFTIDVAHQKDLDAGKLSNSLWKLFGEYNYELSDNVTVEIPKSGTRWLIHDRGYEKEYLLVRDTDFSAKTIDVYSYRCLASIDPRYQGSLDEGTISPELRRDLETNKLFLSENTVVATRKAGEIWLLTDNAKKYVAQKEKNALNIYLSPESQTTSEEGVEYFLADSKSIDPDKPFEYIPDGHENPEDLRPVLMGYELMKHTLRVNRGDVVALMTGKRTKEKGELQERLKAVSKKFIVVGAFKSGWQDIDKRLAYTRIEDLREFLDVSGDVNEICVALKDFRFADESKELIDKELNNSPYIKPYYVQRWEDRQKSLLSAIRLERSVMTIILSLIVVLAVVTIMIILVLLVKEKTRDIGIMKAMGATDLGIMSIFMLNGLCISLFGSIIGTGLGIWFSVKINWVGDCIYEVTGFRVFPKDVYYLDQIPVDINPTNIAVIIIATLGLSLIACTIPALQAARMDVVEALNSESPSFKWWRRRKRKPAAPAKIPDAFYGVTEMSREFRMGNATLKILNDVNMEVQQGEILVIIGSSGAGKSTLLHLMGLLDTPTRGIVFLKGLNLNKYSYRDRARVRNENIGFIFQFYHLLPEFTALENVVLGAWIRYGVVDWYKYRIQSLAKAKDLLYKVGLKDRMSHLPQELSGGERQRVAIARALINDPQIVMCDEPTGNLDEENSQAIQETLWDLNKQLGQTFIIVTHEEAIAKKGHRVFRLEHGKLHQLSR